MLDRFHDLRRAGGIDRGKQTLQILGIAVGKHMLEFGRIGGDDAFIESERGTDAAKGALQFLVAEGKHAVDRIFIDLHSRKPPYQMKNLREDRASIPILCAGLLFCHFLQKNKKGENHMEHIPQKNKKGKRLSIVFLVIACVGLVGASVLDIRYRVFYQLTALLVYAFSFEILNRYYFTTYIYAVEGDDFIIRKRTGKRTQTVCNLALSTMLAIEKKPKTAEARADFRKRNGRSGIHYNYCQSFLPKEPYLILFEFNGKTAEIAFEPNEAMVCLLRERLYKRNESDGIAF